MPSPVISETPILNPDVHFSAPLPKPKAKKGNNASGVLLAILVLLLCVGAYRMFGVAKPKPTTDIVVFGAAKDLPPGYKIGFQDVHTVALPPSLATPDMIADQSQLIGSTTRTFIKVAEPIRTTDILPAGRSLGQILGGNQRAITLKLNTEALVDHSIQPTDRVDVLATTAGPLGKKYTKTISQNILVLMSTPKEMLQSESNRGEQDKITLAVDPSTAEQLTHASNVSTLRIVLRSRGTHSIVRLPGADDRDLLPHEALRVEPPLLNLNPPSIMPPPPAVPAPVAQESVALPEPVQWVVDVFLGNRKEANAFSTK